MSFNDKLIDHYLDTQEANDVAYEQCKEFAKGYVRDFLDDMVADFQVAMKHEFDYEDHLTALDLEEDDIREMFLQELEPMIDKLIKIVGRLAWYGCDEKLIEEAKETMDVE